MPSTCLACPAHLLRGTWLCFGLPWCACILCHDGAPLPPLFNTNTSITSHGAPGTLQTYKVSQHTLPTGSFPIVGASLPMACVSGDCGAVLSSAVLQSIFWFAFAADPGSCNQGMVDLVVQVGTRLCWFGHGRVRCACALVVPDLCRFLRVTPC